MRKVIVNSTPIIGLANIGKLDLLRQVYDQITIPQAVYDELISPSVKKQVEENRWTIFPKMGSSFRIQSVRW